MKRQNETDSLVGAFRAIAEAWTSGEALRMEIPNSYMPEIRQEWGATVLYLPMSGDEDYDELGGAFIRLGLGLLQKKAQTQRVSSAVQDGAQ